MEHADTLQDIVQRREAIQGRLKNDRAQWEETKAEAERELAALAECEKMIVGGIDHKAVSAGFDVLNIEGLVTDPVSSFEGHGRDVRSKAVANAKVDVANGCQTLRNLYIGVKNYSGFGDQREDHNYGMGPRHGSIVFSIGLSSDIRKRIREGGELTQDEINAALYVLSALPKIEAARKEAAA